MGKHHLSQTKARPGAGDRRLALPVISMFYGVIILMYYFDDRKHHKPYIHAQYGDDEAVVSIPEGDLLKGGLPRPNTDFL